ncbi:MAG: carboxyltransferase domain-containing protein [Oscillospiraceae bacterium]
MPVIHRCRPQPALPAVTSTSERSVLFFAEHQIFDRLGLGALRRVWKRDSKSINAKRRALAGLLTRRPIDGVTELVPTYRSLCALQPGGDLPQPGLCTRCRRPYPIWAEATTAAAPYLKFRCLYGGEEFGPDLEYVAQYNGLTPEQVVKLHSKRDYLVYMLGFTPGFPYLGGMDARIATPRLDCHAPEYRPDRSASRRTNRHLSHRLAGRLAADRPHADRAL